MENTYIQYNYNTSSFVGFVVIYEKLTCEAHLYGLFVLILATATDNNKDMLWDSFWFLQAANHLNK